MVENYFNMIANKEEKNNIDISPNVLELSGILELSKEINIKEEYGKHLKEKYSK